MLDQKVRDIMTSQPICLPESATVHDAAQQMRANNIGDVLIVEGDALIGIVTDRDLVIRAIADGLDPQRTTLGQIGTPTAVSITPDADIDDAVRLMRENALRRLPVCKDQRVVGVVSLGDLAAERDPSSALADISNAPPNN